MLHGAAKFQREQGDDPCPYVSETRRSTARMRNASGTHAHTHARPLYSLLEIYFNLSAANERAYWKF